MERGSIGKFVLMAGTALSVIGDAATSEACFLFDCLFGRKSAPVSAYYPTTAVAAAPAAAPATGACGAAQCEQTVLRYVPEVSYRTVWQPVPVTTYRRTVSYNPANGLPMTCTQPCTSYTYQARRVPYTSYRPVYTTVPVTMPAAYPTAPVANVSYAAPVADCGCSAPTASAWTGVPSTGQPYYPSQSPSPGYSTPGATATPPGTTPWERVTPDSQGASGLRGGSPDPASNIPQIETTIEPDSGFSSSNRSLQRLPSISRQYANQDSGAPSGAAATETFRSGDPNAYANRSSGGYAARLPADYNTGSSLAGIPPESRASESRGSDAMTSDLGTSRSSAGNGEQPARSTFDLRPLPNLDPRPSATESPGLDAPPLLNDPRDNTASKIRPIPTRWASNRIVWPANRVSYDAPVVSPAVERKSSTSTGRMDADWSRVDRSEQAASSESWGGEVSRVRRVPTARDRDYRLDPRRVETVRFDSDSPSSTPPTHGWRSTRP